jgi:NAD-dependent SIR2 family protein deacetylase
LAELEQEGIVNCIITENGDRLHQEAGSNNLIEIYELDGLKKHFLETREGWEAIDRADIFLVVGVGWDEHGLIEYARDHSLQILAIAPERPSFMTEGDLYLNGRAEESLPKITKALEA